MSNETVYVGVGSNLGNRAEAIEKAARALSHVIKDLKMSTIYETPPMYREDQPPFLNCVFSGTCILEPLELLGKIHEIEHAAGRDRKKAGWMGPRTIDLDILLFGNRVIDEENLTVPHPRMKERAFVLVPLLELDPLLRDPATGEPYSVQAEKLGREGIYYYAG